MASYIVFRSPYGGLGLRAKTVAKARARIDGVLGVARAAELVSIDLTVAEPAPLGLLEQVHGPLSPSTASRGGKALTLPAGELIATHGHAPDALAAEAWLAFGPPPRVDAQQSKTGAAAAWVWQAAG